MQPQLVLRLTLSTRHQRSPMVGNFDTIANKNHHLSHVQTHQDQATQFWIERRCSFHSLEQAELAFNESDAGNGILYIGIGTGGSGGSASSIVAIGGDGAYCTLSGTQTISLVQKPLAALLLLVARLLQPLLVPATTTPVLQLLRLCRVKALSDRQPNHHSVW